MAEINTGVLIVGGGPIGLACGIECVKRSIDYHIVEKGCLVNSLYHYPYNMTFFSTSEKLEIGDVPFISHSFKPTRSEALDYYRGVTEKWKLKVNLYERVIKVEKEEENFVVLSSKNRYQSKAIILATGFYDLPYLMNIKGEELPKVKHYYKEPHPYFRKKVLVVGAANSAVDVALETYRKGSLVTMVVREKEISPRVKYWVRPDIENRIKENEIQCFFESQVLEIRENEVDIKTPDGLITIENDFVFAMTGYRPDFDFLKKIGIIIQNDEKNTPVYNPKTMEANIDNVFLAGVICGGLQTNKWFIENSRVHAEIITEHLAKKFSD